MIKHILPLLFFVASLFSVERISSYPFITGDTFRSFCDFTFDEIGSDLDPLEVKDGHKIYVNPDFLSRFFSEVHPFISSRYILITHNSDYLAPCFGSKTCPLLSHLDDEKIIGWFGFNLDESKHPKLHALPLGIANAYLSYGNIEILQKVQNRLPSLEKDTLLYMNFSKYTYPQERGLVFKLFKNEPYCKTSSFKPFEEYLEEVAHSKFALSPRGYCLDCFRVWESLLMGTIPIVKTSSLDSLYEGLPILIIQNWEEISEKFLLQKYEEMQDKQYNLEKLYISYWQNFILSYVKKTPSD